jgi:hypothetical protein
MAEGKLLVVVIRTPKSDRYLPIESLFKDDQRFKLEYIEASMTPSYSEVSNRTIAYSAELFEYFQGRKLTPAEIRQKAIDDRNKKLDDRKKALDERKKKIAEDKEAAKKAKETKTEGEWAKAKVNNDNHQDLLN